MRGADTFTESLFTMRHLDDFVPANHPLRPIRVMVNAALLLKFDTSGTQVLDFIRNRFQIADYKSGLVRFSGVGSANSRAANSDFCAGVISVSPVSVLPSAVCTVCW